MPLGIQSKTSRDFTQTIVLDGRLDTETAPALDQEIDRIAGAAVRTLVFDLARLEYISSAGLRCFARAQKVMKARTGTVLLVHPQATVKKVLDIVKAVPVSSIFSSVRELDEYLDEMQKKVRDGD
jgi:anti-anti-sigma factor